MSRDMLVPLEVEFNEPGFKRFARLLWQQIFQIHTGKTANTGEFTLDASTTTTTVDHPGFEATMTVYFTPKTANAAAEVGAGGMYISAKADNQFTVTHANNAQTDRDFDYLVAG